MTYDFGNSLYRNHRDLTDAIASSWLWADGRNDPTFVAEALQGDSDLALAEECIQGWGLDQARDDFDPHAQSHMTRCGYDRDDLIDAFHRFRVAFANTPRD